MHNNIFCEIYMQLFLFEFSFHVYKKSGYISLKKVVMFVDTCILHMIFLFKTNETFKRKKITTIDEQLILKNIHLNRLMLIRASYYTNIQKNMLKFSLIPCYFLKSL